MIALVAAGIARVRASIAAASGLKRTVLLVAFIAGGPVTTLLICLLWAACERIYAEVRS